MAPAGFAAAASAVFVDAPAGRPRAGCFGTCGCGCGVCFPADAAFAAAAAAAAPFFGFLVSDAGSSAVCSCPFGGFSTVFGAPAPAAGCCGCFFFFSFSFSAFRTAICASKASLTSRCVRSCSRVAAAASSSIFNFCLLSSSARATRACSAATSAILASKSIPAELGKSRLLILLLL